MIHNDKTEVLVVGAGPVGLVGALLLSKFGIKVKIIDQEERTTSRSYACALHPRTLELLDRLDLASEVLKAGHRIDTIVFYESESRRAEIKLSKLSVDFPFVVVLPQSALEKLLEQSLRKKNISVDWNHRLASLRTEGGIAVATIEKAGQTAKGYMIADWEWVVEKTLQTTAAFVLGADGTNSHVRQCLDIDYERVGVSDSFAVYEFESGQKSGHEVCIVLDKTTTNVLWPLSGGKYRWSFQLSQPGEFSDRTKDRIPFEFAEPPSEHDSLHVLQTLIGKRAPWFRDKINAVTWTAEVQFERRLAKRFGHGRCWLAGDAVHQTAPIGLQSMNVGLSEAEELACKFAGILRDNAPLDSLETYSTNSYRVWQRLLGLKEGVTSGKQASPWVQERAARILSCIPASGAELAQLVGQIGLQF